MDAADAPVIGKRSVYKVRRAFLNKTADKDELQTIDPATKYITNHDVWIFATSLLNSAKDSKVSATVRFFNTHFNIGSITIGNHPRSKVVTLNLKVNQKNVNMPWDYMTKRLEAYEDIELLNIAKEFSRLHTGYTKAISTNFGLPSPDNPQSEAQIRKIKARAIRACRELENNPSYSKIEAFVDKDRATFLSLSYSEGLLKKLGHTLETFPVWAKTNGVPALYECDNQEYREAIAKRWHGLFDLAKLDEEGLDLGPEFIMTLYEKEGKTKVGVRYVSILDPMPEGKFVTGYMLVKSKKKSVENENLEEDPGNPGNDDDDYESDSTDSSDTIKKNIKKDYE